ncbi:UDP-N-acetylglucosamine--N-acetylmuramyl-(pentapeptide) pyrophosphoryl-undecaprenol N-acetylglucosamine transferase [Actinospica sp. MGRD01-02]|uniref:UDP-N-acetylglucosamine--N-acetylmuramyl-(pentapeptide) pyrophosphoryl-undecaprenol N-acetylglucosamine transferase n=1 Tax=Actinospica acidithermotolerans TaxID=2828514 RepID=A0A941IK60_9ACTN|nr:UDP-N-acetylglucosamine--N-acetylmuramyl-(pentapeptide) pyrophosphoryl-undecaprenol N-acetylglucosamine transferase [Actinospica acidithermotolerans]MBR7828597.1 UDP-N-acetylglucosamine--N-acetylmuramyl-(pentapeptide) pyrophosphoryl-undecaprenol N-acetylglucosamine transferase [Actinospica acidithermotolerans]
MTEDAPLHVVLAGGGSAGHIEPALALADALCRRDARNEITCIGTTRGGLDTRLIPARGYPLELIPAVPMPRKPTIDVFTVPSRLAGTVRRTVDVLDKARADIVVGFGGHVALPAYFAARRRSVPIVVHEANVRPGLANRIGARMTEWIATGSPDCRLSGGRYLGVPLRRMISELDRRARREEAIEFFGLRKDAVTLLVSGGSLGARRLNEAIEDAAEQFSAAGVQILHALGRGAWRDDVEFPVSGAPYVRVPYLDRMDLAYAAADAMLCRGGMMTCSELAAVGLPAVYVPLPIGNGEQRLNAAPVVRAGGGLLVEDEELTPAWLAANLLPLLADREKLDEMGKAAAEFGRRNGDEALVDLVYEAVRGGAAEMAEAMVAAEATVTAEADQ